MDSTAKEHVSLFWGGLTVRRVFTPKIWRPKFLVEGRLRQPRSQGVGGGKKRDPGNEVAFTFGVVIPPMVNNLSWHSVTSG